MESPTTPFFSATKTERTYARERTTKPNPAYSGFWASTRTPHTPKTSVSSNGRDVRFRIVITNFNLSNLKKSLLKDFRILDTRTHEEYSDKFRLIFLSLQEVPKYWEECETELIR